MLEYRIIPTEFTSDGQQVRGDFVVPSGPGPFPGICKFHGFPGSPNQTHGIASELAKAGFVVLTFDFRGFRRSEGFFRLRGEIQDGLNAIDHLLSSRLSERGDVGVYGASFGAAIATLVAAKDLRVRSNANMPFF